MRYNRGMIETPLPLAPGLWATVQNRRGTERLLLAIGVVVSAPADTLGAGGEDPRLLPHRVDAAGLDRQPGH